jgi:hypothetical protein
MSSRSQKIILLNFMDGADIHLQTTGVTRRARGEKQEK